MHWGTLHMAAIWRLQFIKLCTMEACTSPSLYSFTQSKVNYGHVFYHSFLHVGILPIHGWSKQISSGTMI